jgi:hypothetical protein
MTDDRSRVYRRVGERYADACVIQRRYFSGCSVMVWGGVKERGRTLLVVDAGYLTGRRYVISLIQAQANNVTFLDVLNNTLGLLDITKASRVCVHHLH